jgi:prepilin-type N-terminal cleavage/methylation domain-containing protein
MRKKGFTLIELLVVIAIIAMLLAILMPALNKVKRLAQRLICGTNVKGLGTAMMVYAQDFDDEYPLQGGNGEHLWGDMISMTKQWDYLQKDWSDGKSITIGASLYLLIRVADVDPKSFVCKSGDQRPYDGFNPVNDPPLDLVELWDFGVYLDGSGDWREKSGPKNHVSYAYQQPYQAVGFDTPPRPANSTASASTAIMADKNPWMDPKLTHGVGQPLTVLKRDFMTLVSFLGGEYPPSVDGVGTWATDSTTSWQVQIANSQPHGREGQNVLFGDGHSSFEKRPDCSYQNDNIYTQFAKEPPDISQSDRRVGWVPPGPADYDPVGVFRSISDEDTVLANDDSRSLSN